MDQPLHLLVLQNIVCLIGLRWSEAIWPETTQAADGEGSQPCEKEWEEAANGGPQYLEEWEAPSVHAPGGYVHMQSTIYDNCSHRNDA